MTEKQTIGKLTWTELTSIRRYYADLLSECYDQYGICKINMVNQGAAYTAELARLDKYIQAKYEKVKSDSSK